MKKTAARLKAFFSSDSPLLWHIKLSCGIVVLSLLVLFSYDQVDSIYQECVAHEQESNGDTTRCEMHLQEQNREHPLDGPVFSVR